MELKSVNKVYFLGIGGIGMSALARWFRLQGLPVAGYDATPSQVTDKLGEEEIPIHFEDDPGNIPETFKKDSPEVLVVYTPAIGNENKEKKFFLQQGYSLKKRSEVLGMISKDHFTIAIAGTHGKTSTTAMLAHLLFQAGRNMVAFLGGISKDYDTNFIINTPGGKITRDTVFVVEADEFDRSFLHLFPDMAIITNMDPDHLDIYGTVVEVEEAFCAFARQIKENGLMVLNHRIINKIPQQGRRFYSYGLEKGDYYVENIRSLKNGISSSSLFILKNNGVVIGDFELGMAGYHNIENSIAALIVALDLGVDIEQLKKALYSFKGVKRRFEFIINVQKEDQFLVMVDDYAHHPAEIRQLLRSVRDLFPERKISVIFQPHLYSRTRDFAEDFGASLSLADELYLLDIYPAREDPIPGVDAGMILNHVNIKEKITCNKKEVMEKLEGAHFEVLLTVGAGDIDRLVMPIRQSLARQYNLDEVA